MSFEIIAGTEGTLDYVVFSRQESGAWLAVKPFFMVPPLPNRWQLLGVRIRAGGAPSGTHNQPWEITGINWMKLEPTHASATYLVLGVEQTADESNQEFGQRICKDVPSILNSFLTTLVGDEMVPGDIGEPLRELLMKQCNQMQKGPQAPVASDEIESFVRAMLGKSAVEMPKTAAEMLSLNIYPGIVVTSPPSGISIYKN